MRTNHAALALALALGVPALNGCSTGSPAASNDHGVAAVGKIKHATIADIPGSSLKQVILSPQAQARLGIATAPVKTASQGTTPGTTAAQAATGRAPAATGRAPAATGRAPAATGREGLTVIPYSAVLYDVDGKSWAFTSAPGGGFQRESLTIKDIIGPNAYLSSGPAVGTAVVAVGAAELYGAELGVGK